MHIYFVFLSVFTIFAAESKKIMGRIYDSLTDLVGHTPLLRLGRWADAWGLPSAPLAKLEMMNPAGSVKDRTALWMIDDAEKRGVLTAGGTIIEPTSGNTGVGMAMISRVRGYRLILTMPDTMSKERIGLLKAYGAEVVLTPGKDGMAGSVAEAQRLEREIKGAVILGQFDNKANPLAHYESTANEIWTDTDGHVDAFVAGVGTGGTLCGTARKLKELNNDIYIIGVEPASSPMISEGRSGAHKLQGIGANFVPENYDDSVVDEVMGIDDDEAIRAARLLSEKEGLLCGFSGGAALVAAGRLIGRMKGGNVVVVLPDGGERYLSTELFADRCTVRVKSE